MDDWIDKIREERAQGINRALLPSAHNAVNARYPGITWEYCFKCGEPTGRAGAGEDSLYDEQGQGPYCESCCDAKAENDVEQAREYRRTNPIEAERRARLADWFRRNEP